MYMYRRCNSYRYHASRKISAIPHSRSKQFQELWRKVWFQTLNGKRIVIEVCTKFFLLAILGSLSSPPLPLHSLFSPSIFWSPASLDKRGPDNRGCTVLVVVSITTLPCYHTITIIGEKPCLQTPSTLILFQRPYCVCVHYHNNHHHQLHSLLLILQSVFLYM